MTTQDTTQVTDVPVQKKTRKAKTTKKPAEFDVKVLDQLASLEPEQIALMPEGLQSLLQQHQQAIANAPKKSSAKKVTPAVELYRPDPDKLDENGCMVVNLGQLARLDVSGIPYAKNAVRSTNEEHVAHMRATLTVGGSLPPIGVQLSSIGPIVYDGYHRWSAYTGELTDAVYAINQERIDNEDFSLEQAVNEESDRMPILVKPLDNDSERVLIINAYEANKQNGQAMSEQSRTQYAIFILLSSRQDGTPVGLNQACRIAGCKTHSAVSQQIKRNADKAGMTVDQYMTLSPEEADEVMENAQVNDAQNDDVRMQGAIKRLITAINTIVQINDKEDVLITLFKPFIKADNADAIDLVCGALYAATPSFPDVTLEQVETNVE